MDSAAVLLWLKPLVSTAALVSAIGLTAWFIFLFARVKKRDSRFTASGGALVSKVTRIARIDGGFLMLGGVLGLVFSSGLIDLLACAAILVAGAVEWRGAGSLRRRNATGLPWLIRVQCFLILAVSVYLIYKIGTFDLSTYLAKESPQVRQIAEQLLAGAPGMTDLIGVVVRSVYGAVLVCALFAQSGLLAYYCRRKEAIHDALAYL